LMPPFFKELMDKDTALAVLSLGSTGNLQKIKNSPMQSIGDVLLIIRVDRNKFPQIKNSIEKACIAKYNGKIISEDYHGVKISSFKAAGLKQTVSYIIISDTVVIGNSLEGIKKSIELFKNENTQNLAHDADFQNAAARIKKDSLLWGYSNHKNYYADYLKQIEKIEDPKTKAMMLQLKPLADLVEAVKDASFYVDYDKKSAAFIFKSYTMLDMAKDKSGFVNIIARDKAVSKEVFSLIPKDAIGYYACNQDALKCWEFLMNFISNPGLKQAKAASSSGAIIKLAESLLGVDLKNDLIALVGDDFGIVFVSLDEMEIPGKTPSPAPAASSQNIAPHILFPQLYIFCETKDKAKLEKVMGNIFQKIADNINMQAKNATKTGTETQTMKEEENLPVTLPVENYKDTAIHYLKLSTIPFPSVQPNYCIAGKYFIFSISGDLTKKIIETYKSNSGFFNPDIEFTSVKNNLPAEYSAISCFNFQGMIKNLTESTSFKKFHTRLATNSILGFSGTDLDSILAALGTLDKCILTSHKVAGKDVLESQAVLTIKE